MNKCGGSTWGPSSPASHVYLNEVFKIKLSQFCLSILTKATHLLSYDWLCIKTPARHTHRLFFASLHARLAGIISRLISCCQPCLIPGNLLSLLSPIAACVFALLCCLPILVAEGRHPTFCKWEFFIDAINFTCVAAVLQLVPTHTRFTNRRSRMCK